MILEVRFDIFSYLFIYIVIIILDHLGRSLHPDLQKGGSIQIEVTCFQVDLYPYHLADSDRLHWGLYKKASSSFFQWLKDSQSQFWDNLCTLVRENFEVPDVHKGNITKYLKAQYSKLMTSCTVLRMSDFTVFRVQSGKKQEQIAFIKGIIRKIIKCFLFFNCIIVFLPFLLLLCFRR